MRGDSIASRAEKVTLPIESWIYFSDSSKYFLFTDFPKCVPFLLGLCVTEVALHLVDLKWQLHLNAAATQASETDRFQREALRLRHEIRQLEASKRRVLNQMSMNMQRARQERQLLTAASRTGQLPPIDESEQKPRGSAKESRGRTSPLLPTRSIRLCSPPADIAPDIEYDEKWSGPWMPERRCRRRRCGLRTAVARRTTRRMPCRAVAGPRQAPLGQVVIRLVIKKEEVIAPRCVSCRVGALPRRTCAQIACGMHGKAGRTKFFCVDCYEYDPCIQRLPTNFHIDYRTSGTAFAPLVYATYD